MSSSPVGLTIGSDDPRKPQWIVGKKIGTGACASVHLLLNADDKKTSGFVVKIVPLPKKTTKNKKTLPERNVGILNFERTIYQNIVPELQGYSIPKLPSYVGPPVSGQVNGFQYLVLQQMKDPIWDVVPPLLGKATDKVPIGPIGSRLLECVSLFHTHKHILVDVKPENFMLAFTSHDSKKKSPASKSWGCKKACPALTLAKDLSSKIRLLDLGLITRFVSTGHRPDEGISDIVGTPLYSSLNIHENHTPSRRDDIESVGYVVSELIIRLVATSNGTANKFDGTDIPSYLPWSHGKSDKEIGEIKKQNVNNIDSEFYKRMGDKELAKTMKKFFDLTQSIGYKENPDYDEFDDILSNLVVPIQTKKRSAAARAKISATASAATAAAANTTGTGRPKRATRNTRSAKRLSEAEQAASPAKKNKHEDEFVDAQMDLDSVDGSDYQDAEEMDWELEEKAKENRDKTGAQNKGFILQPRNTSSSFGLVDDVVIGTNPGSGGWQFVDDKMGASHCKLVFSAGRQVCSIRLTDLKSGCETIVKGTKLKKGGSKQLFLGDSFTIGNTTIDIQELSGTTGAAAAAAKTTKSNRGPAKTENANETNDGNKAKMSKAAKAEARERARKAIEETATGKMARK